MAMITTLFKEMEHLPHPVTLVPIQGMNFLSMRCAIVFMGSSIFNPFLNRKVLHMAYIPILPGLIEMEKVKKPHRRRLTLPQEWGKATQVVLDPKVEALIQKKMLAATK